jgi:hypothetical protein
MNNIVYQFQEQQQLPPKTKYTITNERKQGITPKNTTRKKVSTNAAKI